MWEYLFIHFDLRSKTVGFFICFYKAAVRRERCLRKREEQSWSHWAQLSRFGSQRHIHNPSKLQIWSELVKKCGTYTMEYHSAMRKEDTFSFVTTRLDLEHIKLSKISKTERDKYHLLSLIHGILKKVNLWKTIKWWLPEDRGL